MGRSMADEDRLREVNPYAAPLVQGETVRPARPQTEGIDPAFQNPFLTIWTRPRTTIRGIVDTDSSFHVTSLAAVGGILNVLDRAAQRSAGDQLPFFAILGIAIVLGPMLGVVGLMVGGWILGWTGRWLGGHARPEEMRQPLRGR